MDSTGLVRENIENVLSSAFNFLLITEDEKWAHHAESRYQNWIQDRLQQQNLNVLFGGGGVGCYYFVLYEIQKV